MQGKQSGRTLTSSDFKDAMAQFATGITVVTTLDSAGHYIGMTANSFNAVSLHPPLVLWSLAKKASSHAAFVQATHYGVSVLAADQTELVQRFSSYKGDRFAGVATETGITGCPLIAGAVAQFECKVRSRHDEGDHLIMVGEVVHCTHTQANALVYHKRTVHSL